MAKLIFVVTETNRQHIVSRIQAEAKVGDVVEVKPATRNLEQNAMFHAIAGDFERQAKYQGRTLNLYQWKALLVSGHAVATGEGADILPGLEGEFVNIRESTSNMSKKRSSSLIEYSLAYGHSIGVKFRDFRY
jgi:hypothetical protein